MNANAPAFVPRSKPSSSTETVTTDLGFVDDDSSVSSSSTREQDLGMVNERPRMTRLDANFTRICSLDLGINPIYTVYDPVNGTSLQLLQNVHFQEVLLSKQKAIESLQSRIDRRDFVKAREHYNKNHLGDWERTRTQYRNTTKTLKKKLSNLHVHLHNFVHHEHCKAAKRRRETSFR